MQMMSKPMAKQKRDDEPVKIDRAVLSIARIVAAYRGMSVAEYLSERLRPLVAEDHAEEVRALQESGEVPPASTKRRKKPTD